MKSCVDDVTGVVAMARPNEEVVNMEANLLTSNVDVVVVVVVVVEGEDELIRLKKGWDGSALMASMTGCIISFKTSDDDCSLFVDEDGDEDELCGPDEEAEADARMPNGAE